MACYSPWVPKGEGASRPLACGRCIGCKLARASDLATRCMHEASCWESNSFVLLTYKDAPHSLEHYDFQCFMKRLRARNRARIIRYFMCGEYGSPSADNGFTYRPHYHAIIFNWWPDDAVYFKRSQSGHSLYRSEILESLWKLGHATLGTVTFDSARYVAKYCTKKYTISGEPPLYDDIDLDTGEIKTRLAEYGRMSNGGGRDGHKLGGLGSNWYEKFKYDVYPEGKVTLANGVKVPAPKYYDKKFRKQGFGEMMLLAGRRRVAGLAKAPESFPGRLEAREAVVKAQLSNFKLAG